MDYEADPIAPAGSILERLKTDCVFAVQRTERGFMLYEMCDRWYGSELSADELRRLADELRELAATDKER